MVCDALSTVKFISFKFLGRVFFLPNCTTLYSYSIVCDKNVFLWKKKIKCFFKKEIVFFQELFIKAGYFYGQIKEEQVNELTSWSSRSQVWLHTKY